MPGAAVLSTRPCNTRQCSIETPVETETSLHN